MWRATRRHTVLGLFFSLALVAAPQVEVDTSTRTYTVTASTAEEPYAPKVVIRGNRVLPAQVYLVLLDAPDRWPIPKRAVQRMQDRLMQFLNRAGYELARVQITPEKEQLVVDIDEGRLERITFPGQSGLGALRMQLGLDLPADVFNKTQLDEQLQQFQKDHDIRVKEYKLVPVGEVLHTGIQLSEIGYIRGVPIVPDQGSFELQIFVNEKDLPPGFHMSVDAKSGDGLRTRFKYRTGGIFTEDERWEGAVEVGLRVQDILTGSDGQRFVSRGGLGLLWYSPKIGGLPFRFIVNAEGLWLSRQRLDLGISLYDAVRFDPTAAFAYKTDRATVSLGSGAEYQYIASLNRDEAIYTDELSYPPKKFRPIILAQLDVELGHDSMRLDRYHNIEAEIRTRLGSKETIQNRFSLEYDVTFGFGFDDLRLRASGLSILGQVAFTDEARFGDQLRGLFNDEVFCSNAAGVSAEYRISIARDLYKIGLFHDGAVCGPETSDKLVWGNAFGVGFHALIVDTFRFSINFAQGFATGGRQDQGVSLGLSQVF